MMPTATVIATAAASISLDKGASQILNSRHLHLAKFGGTFSFFVFRVDQFSLLVWIVHNAVQGAVGTVVVMLDVCEVGLLELPDARERAAAQAILRHLVKPAFDHIQPGTALSA
jgi:hypothetical protein